MSYFRTVRLYMDVEPTKHSGMIYKTSCLALFYEKIGNDRFQLT